MNSFGWGRHAEDGDFRLKNARRLRSGPANGRPRADASALHPIQRLPEGRGADTGVGATSAAAPMDADGSERYSRCAKSIVQVGPAGAGPQNQVSKPVGLPLEIVPEANPYGVPRSANLPVRVIYAGRPLAGALVKLTDLNNDASPFEVHLTDHDGRATFNDAQAGAKSSAASASPVL